MAVSVFDIFKIGIGPSSSHTVGPMRAARQFLLQLDTAGQLDEVAKLRVDLFGSLGLTGRAHGSDTGILLGLSGREPETVDPDRIASYLSRIRSERSLHLLDKHDVLFDETADLIFHRDESLPYHPNGMRFTTWDGNNRQIASREY